MGCSPISGDESAAGLRVLTPLSKGADWPQASGGILTNQTHARLDQIVLVVPIMFVARQDAQAVWTEQHA